MSQKKNTNKSKAQQGKPFPKKGKQAKKPVVVMERTKKKNGLKPGSRNAELPMKADHIEAKPKRDPRLGSKKPVALDA